MLLKHFPFWQPFPNTCAPRCDGDQADGDVEFGFEGIGKSREKTSATPAGSFLRVECKGPRFTVITDDPVALWFLGFGSVVGGIGLSGNEEHFPDPNVGDD